MSAEVASPVKRPASGEPPQMDEEPAAINRQPRLVSSKAERRAARETVAAYHEEQLGRLVEYVASAIDRHRAGELDAFDVDAVVFQYSRAAKELWKLRNLTNVEIAARDIAEHMPADWWERGGPRQR